MTVRSPVRRAAPLDAVVVGAGPNGLAAAITLAREGYSVRVLEAESEIGGGTRTEERTLPGFLHDVCSAVHPLAVASPFLRALPLARHGLDWVHAPAPLAHPLDDRPAVLLERSIEATAGGLADDGEAWMALYRPLTEDWDRVVEVALGPPFPPAHPTTALRLGATALRSAQALADGRFGGVPARALVAGMAAHSALPLDRPPTGGLAVLLGAAGHAVGWPFPRGGARRIHQALAAHLRDLGGEIETGRRIGALAELPPARVRLLDVTPAQLRAMAGSALPAWYRRRLEAWEYGPAAFKVDWALDGPVPWSDPACARAGTLHLGGTFEEIAAAEAAVARGRVPERPFVLLAQPSGFDPTRTPPGMHVLWGYTHVPRGAAARPLEAIERQIERFAPGFRDRVRARAVLDPAGLEAHDANHVGGSIGGGAQDLGQTLARPIPGPRPWVVPLRGLYLCSASTSPGAGVHGMCGHLAARTAMTRELR